MTSTEDTHCSLCWIGFDAGDWKDNNKKLKMS